MTTAACLHRGMVIDPGPLFAPDRRPVVATAIVEDVLYDPAGSTVVLVVEVLSVWSPDVVFRPVRCWRVERRGLDPETEFTVYEVAGAAA